MTRLLPIVCLILLPFFAFSQKAYEQVFYKGSMPGYTIQFILGDGYVGASCVRLTNSKNKKRYFYRPEYLAPDEEKKIKFLHYNGLKPTADYFIMEGMEDVYEGEAPHRLYGNYYTKGKVQRITITRYKP